MRQSSSFDSAAQIASLAPLSMAHQSGGAARKKLASSSAAGDAYTGEDRISALPDDLVVLILLCLPTTAEAVRTSVLSHRWRPVWKRLPKLRFDNGPDLRRISELIDVPDPDPEALVPELSLLSVKTKDADPESASAWLRAAARRVTGGLVFDNYTSDVEALWFDDDDDEGEAAAQEWAAVVRLPCFTKARGILLDLGFMGLALPSAGTFTRLTELRLFRVLFQGSCKLGDVVSSPRCPRLCTLAVQFCHGIDCGNLAIRFESLLWIHLMHLGGFRRLTMVTSALKWLDMVRCLQNYDHANFVDNGGGGGGGDAGAVLGGGGSGAGAEEGIPNYPIVQITAPQLESLGWDDKYDPQAVHFGNVEQLKQLRSYLYVYLQEDNDVNDNCRRLLQRFQVLETLTLLLIFQKDLTDDLQYVMEDITMLPKIVSLKLSVRNRSHAFGACCFHLLRMCTSIRRLTFQFFKAPNMEVQFLCPSNCLCEQQTEWKTEKLNLMYLEEVVIINTNGTGHEITFFKHLFDWAVKLKRMRLMYHSSTESKVNEVQQKLQSFVRPETCITLEELPKCRRQ